METSEAEKSKIATTVEELLEQIRQATKGGNYIYRGENKDYGKVSSKLYRHFLVIAGRAELQQSNITLDLSFIKQPLESQLGESVKKIDLAAIEKILKENILGQIAQKGNYPLLVEEIQKDLILREVQEYVDFEKATDILAELQHYGGATNLIDFSHDLAIALFFACDGEPQENGRLILLDKKSEGVVDPKKNQNNRIVFQKSVFVQRDDGYIEENEIQQFIIHQNLKKLILTYVQNYFDIRTETVYGDLIGYIQNQEIHSEARKQFFAGLFHYKNKEFKESINCFTKAIDLKPNFADAYNNRGNVKTDLDTPDFKGAIIDYTDAIDLNPNYAEAYNNRGNANAKMTPPNLKKAIADYNKAIELSPDYALAHFNLGNAYEEKGDYDHAIADYKKAIELNPRDMGIHHRLGNVYSKQMEHESDITEANWLIEQNPEATSFKSRGDIFLRKGDHALAIEDYYRAIAKDSDYAEAYRECGIAQKAINDNKGAKASFQKGLQLAEKQGNKSLADDIRREIANLSADSDS